MRQFFPAFDYALCVRRTLRFPYTSARYSISCRFTISISCRFPEFLGAASAPDDALLVEYIVLRRQHYQRAGTAVLSKFCSAARPLHADTGGSFFYYDMYGIDGHARLSRMLPRTA